MRPCWRCVQTRSEMRRLRAAAPPALRSGRPGRHQVSQRGVELVDRAHTLRRQARKHLARRPVPGSYRGLMLALCAASRELGMEVGAFVVPPSTFRPDEEVMWKLPSGVRPGSLPDKGLIPPIVRVRLPVRDRERARSGPPPGARLLQGPDARVVRRQPRARHGGGSVRGAPIHVQARRGSDVEAPVGGEARLAARQGADPADRAGAPACTRPRTGPLQFISAVVQAASVDWYRPTEASGVHEPLASLWPQLRERGPRTEGLAEHLETVIETS